jgi:hypothetical protein
MISKTIGCRGTLFSDKRQETLKEPLSKADAQARLDAALAAKVPDF